MKAERKNGTNKYLLQSGTIAMTYYQKLLKASPN